MDAVGGADPTQRHKAGLLVNQLGPANSFSAHVDGMDICSSFARIDMLKTAFPWDSTRRIC